ncbi:IPT/TIG domain-containing protein [Sphingobacterium sp. Ag1]|uniref:IPT/TIG domain-containing protein n=1 Tax=Sphingobacterium sp. Ag1 TaxID=1643451 RepID=UPI0012E02ADF|nr:IPT/TIG domain-containing protein [Sphingobacterium sp. Ag1]
MIHRNIFHYCVFLIALTLASCEKTETIDNSNPVAIELETLEVKIMSESEIQFVGNISSLNKEEILDVGFMLYDLSKDPQNPIEISMGKEAAKVGKIVYDYKAKANFIMGQTYGFSFYVKTKKAFYKGVQNSFSVDLIQIDGDNIRYAKIGQKAAIKGDFAQLNRNYVISLDAESSETVPFEISKDNSELSFVLPATNKNHGQSLEIYLLHKKENGLNQYRRKLLTLKLLGTVNRPLPNTYYYGDVLPLSGIGIEKPVTGTLKVVMNGKSVEYNPALTFADFGPFKGNTIQWAIDYGNEVVEFAEPLQLKAPSLSHLKFEPNGYHPSGIIIIHDFDFSKYYGTTLPEIRVGTHKITDAHFSDQSLIFDLKGLPEGRYPLEFVSPMYSVKSDMMIVVKNFILNPLPRKEVYQLDQMTLTGAFIPNQWYVLSIGPSSEIFEAKSATEIDIKIPRVTPGDYKLKLEDAPAQDIKILDPQFTDVSPKTVSVGQNITISGKGLNDVDMVFLNNYAFFPSHINGETIQIPIPYTVLPGKYKLMLRFNYNNKDLATNQYIEIL